MCAEPEITVYCTLLRKAGAKGLKKSNLQYGLQSGSQLKTVRNDPAPKILAGKSKIFMWKIESLCWDLANRNLWGKLQSPATGKKRDFECEKAYGGRRKRIFQVGKDPHRVHWVQLSAPQRTTWTVSCMSESIAKTLLELQQLRTMTTALGSWFGVRRPLLKNFS